MYDPSMRVLTVLELLQAREKVTGAELAAALEVSARTVQRYVTRLQDLGIPVQSTRGPGGAYRLKPGFRLPPMMFSTEEAFALALGLDALTYLGLRELAPATAGASAKLERVLPPSVGEQVSALRAALTLERPRWIFDADVNVLITLAGAVQTQKRVTLEYRARSDETTSRTVEPYGLMQHEGRWFLAGRCLLRQDLRLFRVDRIAGVAVLLEPFERPLEFKLRDFVYHSIASVTAPWPPWSVEVWLDLPPEQLEPRLPRAMVFLTPEGTGTRLNGNISQLEEFAVLLLHVGCAFTVKSPPELLEALGNVANRALEAARGLSNEPRGFNFSES